MYFITNLLYLLLISLKCNYLWHFFVFTCIFVVPKPVLFISLLYCKIFWLQLTSQHMYIVLSWVKKFYNFFCVDTSTISVWDAKLLYKFQLRLLSLCLIQHTDSVYAEGPPAIVFSQPAGPNLRRWRVIQVLVSRVLKKTHDTSLHTHTIHYTSSEIKWPAKYWLSFSN